MGIVVPFPRVPSFECRTVSAADVIPLYRLREIKCLSAEQTEIRNTLIDTMSACPDCFGRGVIIYCRDRTYSPCPCGGTDEDRIPLPDFDGVA